VSPTPRMRAGPLYGLFRVWLPCLMRPKSRSGPAAVTRRKDASSHRQRAEALSVSLTRMHGVVRASFAEHHWQGLASAVPVCTPAWGS